MQLGNVNRGRYVQIGGTGILRIHHIASHIVIGIAVRAQAVRQILNHAFQASVQLDQVPSFFGKERPKGRNIINKTGMRRFRINLYILCVLLYLDGFRMEINQFLAFHANRL